MRRALTLLAASLLAVPLLAACGASATPAPTPTPALPTPQPTARVTPEPSDPPDTSNPAETPTREEAYQQLIVSVPPEIAPRCVPSPKSQPLEPGQLAQADCNLPGGSAADHVSYKLFDGSASMDAFFDIQRTGHQKAGEATGPGCGTGPGEGTWDSGRKDCFKVINDANVMWTHNLLYIDAIAVRNDGAFAKLETFWATAGPVTP